MRPVLSLLARAIAVVLMLLSMPTGSFRHLADNHDWYFGASNDAPLFLSEGRKPADGASAQAMPQAPVPMPFSRRVAPAEAFDAARRSAAPRLLPCATGPPAA